MNWLIVIITAYFLLAVVSLVDRYLLAGRPDPAVYAFYVGILSVLVVIVAPFVEFFIPELLFLVLSFLAGSLLVAALFALYTGLEQFEASRIVTAVGGFIPLFSFFLVWAFPGGESVLSESILISFLLLVAGSVVITWQKKAFFVKSLKISVAAAFLFALSFFLTKKVYNSMPFWNGLIWIRIGGFLAALLFLTSKRVRNKIFQSRNRGFSKKTGSIFLVNQAMGGIAVLLQNWAIALAGIAFLPIIHALQGLEYFFLFVLALIFSTRFPRLLRENLTPKIIAQKITGILLIGAGLILISF